MNRTALAAALVLSAALPAAAQPHRQPQHNAPMPGQMPAPGHGGNGMGNPQVHPGQHPSQQPSHQMPYMHPDYEMIMILEMQEAARQRKNRQVFKPVPGQGEGAKPGSGQTDDRHPSKGARSMGTGTSGAPPSPSPSTKGQGRSGRNPTEAGPRAAPAAAGQPQRATAPVKAKRDPDAKARLPLVQDQGAISMLRTAHAKIRLADHDYGGNDLLASHSIAEAIHHLGGSAVRGSSLGGSGAPGAFLGGLDARGASLGGSGRESQRVSDASLRDSIRLLRHVEAHLSSSTAPGHHAIARREVAEAIRHLHSALQIR